MNQPFQGKKEKNMKDFYSYKLISSIIESETTLFNRITWRIALSYPSFALSLFFNNKRALEAHLARIRIILVLSLFLAKKNLSQPPEILKELKQSITPGYRGGPQTLEEKALEDIINADLYNLGTLPIREIREVRKKWIEEMVCFYVRVLQHNYAETYGEAVRLEFSISEGGEPIRDLESHLERVTSVEEELFKGYVKAGLMAPFLGKKAIKISRRVRNDFAKEIFTPFEMKYKLNFIMKRVLPKLLLRH
jgi:hypothetical protein